MTYQAIFRFPQRISSLMLLLCMMVALSASQISATEQLAPGSSSKQFRNQTASAIPFDRLNPQARQKISTVVQKPSLYRRLPVTAINADPDYFRFLVRHPEVVVNIWQLMGVTKMTTERTGPFSISTNDGSGTISDLELVYGTDNYHIYFGTGTYEGPVLRRKLTGSCVLVLQSKSSANNQGRPEVTSQLDVFLKVENATANLLAKTITPLVGSTADHNFVESLKFVQRLNETTEKNGPGVKKMGQRLNLNDDVQAKFNDVVENVFRRAMNGFVDAPNNPIKVSQVSQPVSGSTRYESGYLPSSAQRTSNGNGSANPQSTVYQRFNDFRISPGHSQIPVQRGQDQRYMRSSTSQPLPARGTQAPNYSNSNADYLKQSPLNGPTMQPARPVHAYYQNQPQTPANSITPASGWRQRKQ